MNIDHRNQPKNVSKQTKWSVGLSECGEDPGTCCITCFLPCVTFGQIAGVLDEGQTPCVAVGCVYGLLMLVCCQWTVSCIYREELRSKFGLQEEPCSDCCVHFFCGPCALCQEQAELKRRGLDPSKGWIGPPNSPPPMPPSMHK